jgi:hypothetical protein
MHIYLLWYPQLKKIRLKIEMHFPTEIYIIFIKQLIQKKFILNPNQVLEHKHFKWSE